MKWQHKDTKFYNIVFPFFGLIKIPNDIIYELNKIFIKKSYSSEKKLLIDSNTGGILYLNKLFKMKNRVEFDYTCNDMTGLINSTCKWGIDNIGNIFDLSNKQEFPFMCKKITRIKDNLIWINTISYPFIIKKYIVEAINLDIMYVYLVYIDLVWYIMKFEYKYNNKESIIL